MEATKLLLFLVLHCGAGDSSGVVMDGQEPLQFLDRLLHATAVGYDLDPMERKFSYVVEAGLGTVNLYKATVLGLGTAHRLRENYIWVNDSGTCLKIDMGVRNVTITVLANVTVGAFFFQGTATIKLEAKASSIEAQVDMKENNVKLELGSLDIVGTETVDVKASYVSGTRLVFATVQGTLKSYVQSFFKDDLESKLRAALEAKRQELNQYILLD
uniref:Putative secreted protein n=1 Tax=Ixodes ricinus TaxID=34613 RepID=A0A6B0V3J6_IXORI